MHISRDNVSRVQNARVILSRCLAICAHDSCAHWSKETPPPGGFPIYYVPSSRTVCKRTPLEKPGTNPSRGVLFLTHGSWWGNLVNRKPPRGGGFLSINMTQSCAHDSRSLVICARDSLSAPSWQTRHMHISRDNVTWLVCHEGADRESCAHITTQRDMTRLSRRSG